MRRTFFFVCRNKISFGSEESPHNILTIQTQWDSQLLSLDLFLTRENKSKYPKFLSAVACFCTAASDQLIWSAAQRDDWSLFQKGNRTSETALYHQCSRGRWWRRAKSQWGQSCFKLCLDLWINDSVSAGNLGNAVSFTDLPSDHSHMWSFLLSFLFLFLKDRIHQRECRSEIISMVGENRKSLQRPPARVHAHPAQQL